MSNLSNNFKLLKLDIPILIIAFNRPELTRKLIESIKPFKPRKIYIAADGPRNEKDFILCNKVKEILKENIDWKCELKEKYQEINTGLKFNINNGLKWFFENEEMGIILEDDCEVNESFFVFCDELLNKYKDDNKIKVISGNFYFNNDIKNSYYFSICPGTHGWATWKRVWDEHDVNMSQWSNFKDFFWLLFFFKFNIVKAHYFFDKFRLSKKSIIDSWDYQFLYSIWKNNGLIIRPFTSLCKHIGWGDSATHSKGKDQHPDVVIKEIEFPLIHPKKYKINSKYDNLEIKKIRGVKFFSYLFFKVSKKIKLLLT